MKHTKQLLAIVALSAAAWSGLASAAPAGAQVSSETWFGDQPVSTGRALSRAEVEADLAMWKRAGLDLYQNIDGNYWDADYQQHLAQYQRLRSGPEYLAELQRLGGSVTAAEGQGAGRVPG
ncbi:MAG: DUF4148 domain-containing protein [Burkholderiaceae bacterium]|jgi:hypothetical protein|nr:DUF4148 domain-containing protein [Burkholderiaceae bacterium]